MSEPVDLRRIAKGESPFGHDHRDSPVDAMALYEDLKEAIRGEVRFDDGSRALYATDASNYRQVPIGVVIPLDAEDVVRTMAACRKHGAPVLSRGGGTSLAGQCCNVAVVMDFTKYMNRIVELDPEKRNARVQPGCVLDDLRDAAERHHLTFGPDPATHNHCVIGGMIGNNSCGIHSVMAGKTDDNVEEMEILTYDGCRMRVGKTNEEDLERIIREGGRRGEIYSQLKAFRDKYADLIRRRYPDIPRCVSGYNLTHLLPENGFHIARALVGSEGTLVTVLEATTRLVHSPPCRSLILLGYPDVYQAGDHVPEVLEFGPIGLEGMDGRLPYFMEKKGLNVKKLTYLPEGQGWLLVEFGGETTEEAEQKSLRLKEAIERKENPPSVNIYTDPEEAENVWKIRESGLGATAFVPGENDTWPGFEDSAVHPDKLGDYLRDFRKLLDEYGYKCSLYGHFGDGCLHVRIDFDVKTHAGITKYRAFMAEASEMVVRYGGSLSGEHGDGQSRAEFLEKMYGEEMLQAFREFKAIWDPDGKMNPGKVVDPYRMDENLRLGTDYRPWEPETHFQYPEDGHSFSRAAQRCVGVGECRRKHSGTMCPSYMVTLEEKHSTRGRAHLLFEMMQGDVITDGWKSEHVKESLDLCLACKGCKGDCPLGVDVATYKAEFLSHYYEGRVRPVVAFSLGLIHWWARLAALMPGMANLMTQVKPFSTALKALGGIAPQRAVPPFAPQTFKQWFRNHTPKNPNAPKVLLWPDTFNNHFHPEIAKAAVEVLEGAGYRVVVPEATLCCGRPLYDYGLLDLAKRQLRQILDALRPEISAGVPMIGLEPSCTAVFRDEMVNLFPNDEDARRLREQTFTLSEFLTSEGYEPPPLRCTALMHGHCHQKALIGLSAEEELMEKMGLDCTAPETGCCGLAGSFGYEKEKYDLSQRCGERVLLPAVREADRETLIITDGFSCRSMIAQNTGRRALHMAQILHMAMGERDAEKQDRYPEADYLPPEPSGQIAATVAKAALIGAAAVAGGLLVRHFASRKGEA
ncbi:MAG: FAD-binding protein [Armatimonadetes bacterium]|nr:FAD-binding protein [Armatimonadota bacterium]